MKAPGPLLLAIACALAAPRPASPQGVVVDEGRFEVHLGGVAAGVEDFTIRRAGIGREDALFANATVQLRRQGRLQTIRPLLRAAPPDGVAVSYQVEVEGPDSMTLRLSRAGRRYVAAIRSAIGEEQREFPAQPDTRILEVDVAHLYYFLRDTREGDVTHVIEPRARAHLTLRTGASVEEEIRLGELTVEGRRVEYFVGEERRTVWFDRLGRVLRVSIPTRGYVAERSDPLR
ncbi:MAG TPA: hypothetical protein VFQ22_07770 [Longimicrobiales bacterium]|nr:hypothetical protein [Longimicrobiales bacterium]